MKVTQEQLPASRLELEVEVPPETSKQVYERVLQKFMRTAEIPGFRKGKIPRPILLQRIGTQRINAAVLEEVIEVSLKEAIKQEDISAIGEFDLHSDFQKLVSEFTLGEPVTFRAVVDVWPEVKIKQYSGLSVQAEDVQYDPKRVEETLETYRSQLATLVPVEGRPAQLGDTVVIDYVGRLTDESLARLQADKDFDEADLDIPGLQQNDFQLELKEGRFLQAFIDGIVGMTLGEQKDVTVAFPEDYAQATLAGQSVIFSITLKELKEKELPDLDDDFAQDVSEFDTLAELRESLEKRFREEAEQARKANGEDALLNGLLEQIETELPETLIRQEIQTLFTTQALRLSEQGIDIKRLVTRETAPTIQREFRPQAVERLKLFTALEEIAKREQLQVEPGKLQEQMANMQRELGNQPYDPDRLKEIVEKDLLREQALAWLADHNTIEWVPEGTLSKKDKNSEAAVEAEDTDAPAIAAEATEGAAENTDSTDS
ncbi:trigger factor [Trichothermofontia sp.]